MSRVSPQLSEKDNLAHETVVARGADGEVLADLGYTQGELTSIRSCRLEMGNSEREAFGFIYVG